MTAKLADLARQCQQFHSQLPRVQKTATAKVATGFADRARATTRQAVPSGILTGVGRSGAKVGVRVEPLRAGAGAIVSATGPYQLVERPTAAHKEPRVPGKKNLLAIPGIGVRRSVRHPGTKGKHPFERAVNGYAPEAPKVYQREVAAAMAKTFRG